MNNKDLIPEHNETIQIEQIMIPQNSVADMNILLLTRLRVRGYGKIVINHKNELISGLEGIILSIERGESEVKVVRNSPISLKLKSK
jgi:hypothetical protein